MMTGPRRCERLLPMRGLVRYGGTFCVLIQAVGRTRAGFYETAATRGDGR
jgi:hypothetical protein